MGISVSKPVKKTVKTKVSSTLSATVSPQVYVEETLPQPPPGMRKPRTIVLLSDGTGNSSSSPFKTNVWRLYQALDLTDPDVQIAAYDDGVGTSSFKPLAILGGAFGWGLKRNVMDLYAFLCRHYQPGDRIYAFGFSRGAFTARVLCGLITRIGVIKHNTNDAWREDKLDLAVKDAYYAYRGYFNQTGGLVSLLRKLRDTLINFKRRLFGEQQPKDVAFHNDVPIEFIGVWDTVAAYGMPFDELTRAIDDYIWPLSMPNRFLSAHVKRACHALAIDDEREAFHPLLWTEELNPKNGIDDDTFNSTHVDEERISQVWFSGVHSDVGGGYPDDAMAHVTLDWMLAREAAWRDKTGVGLRLQSGAVDRIAEAASPTALMHDSRRGLAGYFRYTPRSIASLCHRDDPNLSRRRFMLDTRILSSVYKFWNGNDVVDETYNRVRVDRPKIHVSVFDRMRAGVDGYAPFTLPQNYALVERDGRVINNMLETSQQGQERCQHQEKVWNTVWKRRVTYFATVATSMWLFAFPWVLSDDGRACNSGACVVVPVLNGLKSVVPDIVAYWIDAYANRPGWFMISLCLLFGFLYLGSVLQQRIRDRMRPGWAHVSALYQDAKPISEGFFNPCIGWLRNSALYKFLFHQLKFNLAPKLAALLFAGAIGGIVLLTSLVASERTLYSWDAWFGGLCDEPKQGGPGYQSPELRVFKTSDSCFATGMNVARHTRYRITITVTEPWFDDSIPADPIGFSAVGIQKFAVPLLRAVGEPYFRPIIRIGNMKGREQALVFRRDSGTQANNVFTAEFEASKTGPLFLFVNDALNFSLLRFITGGSGRWLFFENNKGAAKVSIMPLQAL
jgi:uncharacterized protein (DUF2235 family)